MDKCGIGELSGTNCGSVTVKGNMITEYQALSDCQRDITGHLEMLKMHVENAEKELTLLKAGKNIFVALSSQSFPSVTNVRATGFFSFSFFSFSFFSFSSFSFFSF